MSQLKILIAAGGTGGHIYPALAMADAFRQWQPETRIEFVGTAQGLENKIIPAQGYTLHHLSVGRLNSNVSVMERLKTLARLPWAFVQSAQLLRRERPDLVLGVGGHASGPLLLMAALLGFRSAIWEPNAMPGLANRWLARFVDDCWVVFDEAKPLLHNAHLHRAGMPVRQEIEEMSVAPKPVHADFNILVFGGSQGARGINNAVCEMFKLASENLNGLSLVHQTGSADFARIQAGYEPIRLTSGQIQVHEYLHDMGQRYAMADLVICRSGTGTLSELAACGKASILIPLPTASDDHQRKNAESLVRQGAAVMILQKDLTPQALLDVIQSLRQDSARLARMSQAVRQFHQPQAARVLVRQFVERIEEDATR